MAWIESHQTLLTHGKVLKLARMLGITKYQAIGHLQALWWWAIDNATDGSLAGHTPEVVAEAAGWNDNYSWWHDRQCNSPTGCENISNIEFFVALVECHLIDLPNGEQISPNGEQKNQDIPLLDGTRVHDWLEYCGDLVKKRLERQAETKAKSNVLEESIKSKGKTGNKSPPTVPYRTVPNNTITPYSPPKGDSSPEKTTDKKTVTDQASDQERPARQTFGEFGNVRLSTDEHAKLVERLGDAKAKDLIERLSCYMKSRKKNYANHYATLLNWNRDDEKGGDNGKSKGGPRALPASYTEPADVRARE